MTSYLIEQGRERVGELKRAACTAQRSARGYVIGRLDGDGEEEDTLASLAYDQRMRAAAYKIARDCLDRWLTADNALREAIANDTRYRTLLGDLTDDEAARVVRVGRAVMRGGDMPETFRRDAEGVFMMDEDDCRDAARLLRAIADALEGDKEEM